jgi:hypothetical protein
LFRPKMFENDYYFVATIGAQSAYFPLNVGTLKNDRNYLRLIKTHRKCRKN